MPAAFEWRFKPDTHNIKSGLDRHHSLAQREDVRIVMLAAKPGGLGVPAQGATDAFESIGGDGFSIARTAEDDPAFEFVPGHRLGDGRNEERVIGRFLGMRAEVSDTV